MNLCSRLLLLERQRREVALRVHLAGRPAVAQPYLRVDEDRDARVATQHVQVIIFAEQVAVDDHVLEEAVDRLPGVPVAVADAPFLRGLLERLVAEDAAYFLKNFTVVELEA